MAESRLDPVRWRRPARSTLLRLAAVATLLVVAAVIAWSGAIDGSTPQACGLSSSADGAGDDPTDAHPSGGLTTANEGPTPAGDSKKADRPPSVPDSGAPPAPDGAGGADGRPPVPEGHVGVPIRLAEPAGLSLVHPGDRVDLLRVEEAGDTTAVAGAALVLGITGTDDPISGGLLIALSPAQAERAVATPGRGFAVLLRPG